MISEQIQAIDQEVAGKNIRVLRALKGIVHKSQLSDFRTEPNMEEFVSFQDLGWTKLDLGLS